MNDLGMKLQDIRWVQAGANAPGREEKVELNLPDGVEITRVKDKSLSEMLASGDLDCAIIARPPTCFLEDHPDVVRLFPDFVGMEEQYFADTAGLADHAYHRDEEIGRTTRTPGSRATCSTPSRTANAAASNACWTRPCRAIRWPGCRPMAARCKSIFGKDPFPFGIEENRKTWEMMGLYTYQQGIAHRQFTPEEIFPASIDTKVII